MGSAALVSAGNQLPLGPREASSALNNTGSDDTLLATSSVEAENLQEYNGELWLVNTDSTFGQRDAGWVQECSLPAQAVSEYGTGPWMSLQRLIRPEAIRSPQVNLTPLRYGDSPMAGLTSSVYISRSPGSLLSEAYPPMEVRDDHWAYAQVSRSFIGENATKIFYTDQPLWILNNRVHSVAAAILLVLGGWLLNTGISRLTLRRQP